MGITLPQAQFVSLGLTTFLDGLFFTLFFIMVLVMCLNPTESVRRLRVKVLPMASLMLLVATMQIITLWIRAAKGFIFRKSDSIAESFNQISDTTNIVLLVSLWIQSVLGDFVMTWRLYVVYGKRFVVAAPPLVLVICYTVIGAVAVSYIARARPGTDIFHVAKSWTAAYFFLTMATNLICSGAIAWRIFLARHALTQGGARPLWPIISAIIESSALYTLGMLSAFISLLTGSQWEHAAVSSVVPLVGISFCLIVLQIRFHAGSVSSTSGRSRELGRTSGGLSAHNPASYELNRRSTSVQVTVNLKEERSDVSDGKTASPSNIHGLAAADTITQ